MFINEATVQGTPAAQPAAKAPVNLIAAGSLCRFM
jgi:hypothetical protein